MKLSIFVFAGLLTLASTPSIQAQEAPVCLEWNGLRFMAIPGGTLQMGSNSVSDAVAAWNKDGGTKRTNNSFKDELPRHEVAVKPFCMMEDSLSGEQVVSLLPRLGLSKSYLSPTDDASARDNSNEQDNSDPDGRMTWQKAVDFAKVVSRQVGRVVRLPTEAEWEYAARGGLVNKQFPWGNVGESYKGITVRDLVLSVREGCRLYSVEPMIKGSGLEACIAQAKAKSDYVELGEVACYSQILLERVKMTPRNGFGLINVVNNEWEWTSSRYMPYPYKATDGRESPPKLKKEFRVIRGGIIA